MSEAENEPGEAGRHSAISGLPAKWEGTARRKFIDAAREENEMGKKLIEHGAMCYFNCAQELKKALGPAVLLGFHIKQDAANEIEITLHKTPNVMYTARTAD